LDRKEREANPIKLVVGHVGSSDGRLSSGASRVVRSSAGVTSSGVPSDDYRDELLGLLWQRAVGEDGLLKLWKASWTPGASSLRRWACSGVVGW